MVHWPSVVRLMFIGGTERSEIALIETSPRVVLQIV